jgi:class 3 adenylate cyclase
MIKKRTREKLNRLLQERNEHPERAAEVDARIDATFGDTLAVMVMDMSGFSRQAVRFGINHFLAKIHRLHSVALPVIEQHGGEVIKVAADNVYSVFEDVPQAVAAAADTVGRLEAANSMLPEELDMHAEFGIGYGHVLIVEDEDFYGTEVNLASKLGEDIAQGGEIMLTEAACKRLSAAGPGGCEPMGMSVSGLTFTAYKYKSKAL